MKRLLLVRHGETAWNGERRLQGQADIPLSERGLEQARALAPLVRSLRPSTVVTSDLLRAVQTAEALGYTGAVRDPRFREADLGAWVGLTPTELDQTAPGAYQAWRHGTLTPPGAESFEDVIQRVGPALEALLAAPSPVLVVTHGGVVRAALALLLDLYPDRMVPVSPASLTVVEVRDGTGPLGSDPAAKLHSFNVTGCASMEPAPD